MEYILSNMETNRLRHFKTVVEVGGLMKASQVLGISGGGLSKSIKALEEEIGITLFLQRGRGLELTEIGAELYRKLPQALKAIDDLLELKETESTSLKTIKFVSFEVFTTYFLADFISEHLLSYEVEVREAIPGEMEKEISEGHSNIGITYEPIPFKGIDFLQVGKIKMSIYSSVSSQLNQTNIEDIPFVVPISPLNQTPSGVKGLDGWPEHLKERKSPFRVEMMETALQLAHRGVAAAFLPKFVVEAFNRQGISKAHQLVELGQVTGFKPIYRDVFIIQRKSSIETPLVKKLAKSLRKISS